MAIIHHLHHRYHTHSQQRQITMEDALFIMAAIRIQTVMPTHLPYSTMTHSLRSSNVVRNHNQAPNSQSANENPFNDPFFQQGMQGMPGMPPMVNMNMMINNMMMGGGMAGGGDMMIPFGLMRHQRPRVADQGNVDALPTDTYKVNETASTNDESKEDDEDANEGESCSICLEPFKNGDTIKRLPCLHIFHKNEIDRWLLTGNDKCPICRMPINGQQQQQ